jgi:hypothetical protein
MMSAPVLGLSTRLERRGRNVGAGHEKAISDATKGESGHVGGSLCTRSGQSVSTTARISSATLPRTGAPNTA